MIARRTRLVFEEVEYGGRANPDQPKMRHSEWTCINCEYDMEDKELVDVEKKYGIEKLYYEGKQDDD